RLLRSHADELVAGAAAERPARAGEDERVHLLCTATFEALVERRVLAVHRQESAGTARASGERELSRGDEALLVREREVDTMLERPERRMDAGEADNRVQHDVGPGALEQLREVTTDLLEGRVDVVERRRAGSDRAQLEAGMRFDDLDRLAADRPRRAEERDPFHGTQCRLTVARSRHRSARSGNT